MYYPNNVCIIQIMYYYTNNVCIIQIMYALYK